MDGQNIQIKKEKSNKGVVVFLILIILGLAGYIFYDKVYPKLIKTDTNENTKKEEEDSEEKTNNQETKLKISDIVGAYYYKKAVFIEEEGESFGNYVDNNEINLLLKSDGTYWYYYGLYADSADEGTYSIDGNKLTLKTAKHYCCGRCYYTKNLKNIEMEILSNEKIVTSEDKVLRRTTEDKMTGIQNYINNLDGTTNCDGDIH